MGTLDLKDIIFSDQVQLEWTDSQMYEKLRQGDKFSNPQVELQVHI